MSSKRVAKPKSEWSERVVSIERVTKVVKGGKKMSFRAVIVVGNEQGKVGVGVGKGGVVFFVVVNVAIDGVVVARRASVVVRRASENIGRRNALLPLRDVLAEVIQGGVLPGFGCFR